MKMSLQAKWEYMKAIYQRYQDATRKEKKDILDEFCKTYPCHRKHAIRLLSGPPPPDQRPRRRQRESWYGPELISILRVIWETSDYLWSKRLKAALPLWLPWAKRHLPITPELERQLLSISPAQIDRRLKPFKLKLRKRIYGTTKPGTLLKHQIPIKTDSWNVRTPGFFEVDLVSHSGSSAEGDFAHTLDMTGIQTTWVERRAILGKNHQAVVAAVNDIEQNLPFKLRGIDSDNGSEFINQHLHRYCQQRKIQFTRGRPYKKDDNAHVEQKNFTHVRKLFGYLRFDTQHAVDAMNDLYKNELRYFQNLFQPSVKLRKKVRIGSRIKRVYHDPLTPFDRLLRSKKAHPLKLEQLKELRNTLDPFHLAQSIDKKLQRIFALASKRKVSRYLQPVLRASQRILVSRKKVTELKIPPSAKNKPHSDSFRHLKFHPLYKLRKTYEKESFLQTR
jgi:hypothetical protein